MLSPLSKKMGIVIFVLIFTLIPYRWGSTHSQGILDEISSKKIEVDDGLKLISDIEARKNMGDLKTQLDNLRIKGPNDASLPVFIPMLADVATRSNMFLVSGSPSKAIASNNPSQTKLSNPPSGTNIYAIDALITGPSVNLRYLLNNITQMPRVVNVERFSTQPGAQDGYINVSLTIKFYSVGAVN